MKKIETDSTEASEFAEHHAALFEKQNELNGQAARYQQDADHWQHLADQKLSERNEHGRLVRRALAKQFGNRFMPEIQRVVPRAGHLEVHDCSPTRSRKKAFERCPLPRGHEKKIKEALAHQEILVAQARAAAPRGAPAARGDAEAKEPVPVRAVEIPCTDPEWVDGVTGPCSAHARNQAPLKEPPAVRVEVPVTAPPGAEHEDELAGEPASEIVLGLPRPPAPRKEAAIARVVELFGGEFTLDVGECEGELAGEPASENVLGLPRPPAPRKEAAIARVVEIADGDSTFDVGEDAGGGGWARPLGAGPAPDKPEAPRKEAAEIARVHGGAGGDPEPAGADPPAGE